MESLTAFGLAQLEMIFVFVTLMLLHGLRKIIGSAAFYVSIGLLLLFSHIATTAGLEVKMNFWGGNFQIAGVAMLLPALAAMLVIYVCEGTVAMQRLIVGVIACFGFFTYLSLITRAQCNWDGYVISKGPTADTMEYLLVSSQRTMAGTTLAMIMDMFLLPIFYQRLRNLGCRMFFCCLGALLFTQLADGLLFNSLVNWGSSQWVDFLTSSLTIRAVSVLILATLAAIYLSRIEKEIPGEGRNALDIFFAFFGGYSKAKALQLHVNEWEDRYRMVVENASEMIMLLDRQGRIIDVNQAGWRMVRAGSKNDLIGKFFPSIFFDPAGKPLLWNEHVAALLSSPDKRDIRNLDCYTLVIGSEDRIDVSLALSDINFENVKMFIVVGRDVTEQRRLAREKEDLAMQLAHTQRLESIGQLAGGVAHDFNNYLHSILGHLDVIKYIHKSKDEQVIKHINKVIEISEQAAKLTQQLLGFARKGKYVERDLRLRELLRQSMDLFLPSGQGIEVKVKLPPETVIIRGDQVQLQQVLLNLLLNARDAIRNMSGRDGLINVEVVKAERLKVRLTPPADMKYKEFERFWCIVLRDNGEGMSPQIMTHIFEPFFTTKPMGKGTGMGLSMVYGTVVNHGGWVQVDSTAGEGTVFYVFLPPAEMLPPLTATHIDFTPLSPPAEKA